MKIEELKEIMQTFEEANLYKMKLKTESFSIELEREPKGAIAPVLQQPAAVQPEPLAVAEPTREAEAAIPAGTQVKAPLVGVFYASPTPESKPFIEVGQRVQKGQTVCIVEAMKVMNKIEAPCDGVVTIVFPNNGDMVEFDQVLLVIA